MYNLLIALSASYGIYKLEWIWYEYFEDS